MQILMQIITGRRKRERMCSAEDKARGIIGSMNRVSVEDCTINLLYTQMKTH